MAHELVLLAGFAAALWPGVARSVVISEMNHHRRPVDASLELVELTNELSTREDLSLYSFTNGVSYIIPQGTVLGPRAQLVNGLEPSPHF